MSEQINTRRTLQEEATLPLAAYFSDSYFSRRQLFSQASQIHNVHQLRPKRVLEIGKGNGFVADFLSKAGYDVTTFDINPSLKPDVVGSVLELTRHFQESSFDLILCAEVLEHLPFSSFEGALEQVYRVTKQHAYLTLPQSGRSLFDLYLALKLPYLNWFEKHVCWRLASSRLPAEHHWEIGHSRETAKHRIIKILKQWFRIEMFEAEKTNSYHQHIVLRKKEAEPPVSTDHA